MKKFNCAVLAACLLAGALISCGSDTDTAVTPTDSEKVPETTAAVTEAAAQPYIAAEDNGGKTIFLQGFQVYYAPAVFAAEENGDAYNDVIYQRIAKTEEYLNIDIIFDDSITHKDVAKTAQNVVASGDDSIQLLMSHDMRCNGSLVSENLCYDIASIESVDLTRDYWKFHTYDKLTVNGHVYLTKPMFIIPSVGCLTFNKAMVADYDMEEPYNAVKNGTWTLDLLREMAKVVTRDANGDGTMDDNDIYGYANQGDWDLNAYIYASDLVVTDLDENGKIVLSMDTPRTVELFEAMHEFLNQSGDAYIGKGMSMKDGRVLFRQSSTKNLDSLRDCEVEYGIVPYPKLDEAQEGYYGYDISAFISIPSSVSDPELVGKTLEMLNFYSREMVMPTYYDIQLNSKSVRDEESIEMLDLIFEGIVCDAGRTYFGTDNSSMQNLVYSISKHVYGKKTVDFASFYAKNVKGAEKCIEIFYKSVDANE